MKTFIQKLCCSAIIFSSAAVYAQTNGTPGTPDSTFGNYGSFTYDLGNVSADLGNDAVVLPDGRTMVIGNLDAGGGVSDIFILCLKPDGTPDSSWGNNGVGQYDLSLGGDDGGYAIRRQNNGMIVIAGSTEGVTGDDLFVARLDADGNFDPNFANGGIYKLDDGANEYAMDMAILPNGKIVIGASRLQQDASILFVRLLTDGTPDSAGFSSDGIYSVANANIDYYFSEMAVKDDGTIYACGSRDHEGYIGKIKAIGGTDPTFSGGMVNLYHMSGETQFYDIVTDGNGNIWVCGSFDNAGDETALIGKLDDTGTFDTGFDTDGLNEYYQQSGSEEMVFTDMLLTSEGVLCGGKLGSHYVAVMYDGGDGGYNNNFGVGGVADNEGSPSFEVNITELVTVDANRVMFVGYHEIPDLNVGGQVIFVRNPVTVSVENNAVVNMTVYPNPVTESFRVDIPSGEMVKYIEVYTLSGQKVHMFPGNQTQYVLPAGIPAGMYIITIQMSNSTATGRICVVK